MKFFRLLICVVFLVCFSTVSWAGGGAESLLVVVNADSWASKAIANEYVKLRRIPPSHVVYLKDVSTFETISVDDFRTKILKPLLSDIARRKLINQIDCIVYSSDLPYSVNLRSDIAKLPAKPNKIFTPVGSINGMTYLAGLVLTENPNYIGLNTNFYSRMMHRPGVPLPKSIKRPTKEEAEQFKTAMKLVSEKKWKEAADSLEPLAKAHPNINTIHYNLACCYARLNLFEKTMQSLNAASAAGLRNSAHAEKDEDLQPYAKKKEFITWLDKMKAREELIKKAKLEMQPSQAFRSRYQWSSQRQRVTKEGMRYFLSTMLSMTSGQGNSVEEAITSLRRSKQADETHPKGTIYILKNKNVRSRTREKSFAPTVAKLKTMGIDAEIIEGILPQKKNDVMGVVIGSSKYPWEGCGSKILPGAIVESLTSSSGVMRELGRPGQTPISNMIRHGASASSGTVTEPYALQAKFPNPFIHVHYASGCSLAEAYYQSLAGPYQLLIVGDPLCQPWATKPKVTVQEIYPGMKIRKPIELTPLYNGNPQEIAQFQLCINGQRTAICKPNEKLSLDTSKMPAGYNEIRVVAVKAGKIETEGSAIIPIEIIGNDLPTATLTLTPGETVAWNQTIVAHVECEGADEILLVHNTRRLGQHKGEQTTFKINAELLGQGFVSLFAVAKVKGKMIQSAPVTVEIVPPAALPAVNINNKTDITKGLLLSGNDNKKHAVVSSTFKADWLQKKKLLAETEFKLSGLFVVKSETVYQFQLNGNCRSQLFIDDVELKSTNEKGWKYLPVHLAKGMHRFELRGKTPKKNPRLRIVFGGQGTTSIGEKRFSHLTQMK